MKKILLSLLALTLAVSAFAMDARQPRPAVTGRILDENHSPIAYATITAIDADSIQRGGITSNEEGRFTLAVEAGNYTVMVRYIGYTQYSVAVDLQSDTDLGDIVLQPQANEIQGVVVKAQMITRKADRFVVDVANNPAEVIGKDGIELLNTAPGVWIDDEKISINGTSGTRVMINDRMLNLSGDDLMAYLRALNAEDIQRVEVIPIAGAEYDANSSGGIIRIVLKKQRTRGVSGSVQARMLTSEMNPIYVVPSASISYHHNKIDINASVRYSYDDTKAEIIEQADVPQTYTLYGTSLLKQKAHRTSGSFNTVYQINDRNSIGAELSMSARRTRAAQYSESDLRQNEISDLGTEDRDGFTRSDIISATANYILKLDTLESTFKVIGDYYSYSGKEDHDYVSQHMVESVRNDSTYMLATATNYRIYSLSASVDKRFNEKFSLNAGLKFNRNEIFNDQQSRYIDGQASWVPYSPLCSVTDYAENIGAAYGIFTANLGKVNFMAGLRAEYTNTVIKDASADDGQRLTKNYLSLFPNANISVPLDQKSGTSLILSYARSISRPSIYQLNQFQPTSEYAYITGNPDLKPTYSNRFSLSLALFHKYNITFGGSLIQDFITQIAQQSQAAEQDIILYRFENIPSYWEFYVAVNLPFKFTDWLSLNTNFIYNRNRQQLFENSERKWYNMFQTYNSLNITLPHDFYISASYFLVAPQTFGNLHINLMQSMDVSLKKSFSENRFTVSATVSGLFRNNQTVKAMLPSGGSRTLNIKQDSPSFSLSLRYNFSNKVKFKQRRVQSDISSERSRSAQ